MPRPFSSAPTAATSTTPEQGLSHTDSGATVAAGAAAMIQLAAGAGHVMGGVGDE